MVKKKSKPKKVKSVERQKISSTAVLNDSNMNNNQQQVQIIFPADIELRKVKKRKRKPSGESKKKKEEKDNLLNELKEKLKEYDTVQQEAADKKIPIPSELGVSTITKADLKTNEDIQTFITDVVNKTQKMRELIAEAEQKLSQPSRSFPLRMGAGIMRFPTEPAFSLFPPPAPTPQQPKIIPPTPIPTQTKPIPTQATTTQTDPTLEALQQIAKETESELEKSGVDVPEPPQSARNPLFDPPLSTDITRTQSAPSVLSGTLLPNPETPVARPPTLKEKPKVPPLPLPVPQVPQDEPEPQEAPAQEIQPSDLELFAEPEYPKTQAPRGLDELYRKLRLYIKNVLFVAQQNQSAEGVYHIPLDQQLGFDKARSNLLVEYSSWFANLNPRQKKYMTTNEVMNNINELMNNYLKIEPKDLAEKELKLQGNKVVEITQGNEKPKLEKAIQERGFKDPKKQKQLKRYEKNLDQADDERKQIEKKIIKITDDSEKAIDVETTLTQLDEIIKNLSQYATDITVDYDKLDDDVKLGVESKYNKLKVEFTKVLRLANERKNKLENPVFRVESGASDVSTSSEEPPPSVKKFNESYKTTRTVYRDLLRENFMNDNRAQLQEKLRKVNSFSLDEDYNELSPADKKIVQKGYDVSKEAEKRIIFLIDNALKKPRPNDLTIIRNYINNDKNWSVSGSESIGAAISRVFGLQEESKINNIKGPKAKTERKNEVKRLLKEYEQQQGPPRVEVAQQEDLPPINFSIYDVD
jgi:hypothetical protein